MEREEILTRVRTVMVRVFDLRDGRGISHETSAADIDGWDSLSHAMLVMGLENEFGVDIPLDRASLARDVGELVDIVHDALR